MKQPWAWSIAHADKRIENRPTTGPWRCLLRGVTPTFQLDEIVALHASAGPPRRRDLRECQARLSPGVEMPAVLARGGGGLRYGAVLGTFRVADVVRNAGWLTKPDAEYPTWAADREDVERVNFRGLLPENGWKWWMGPLGIVLADVVALDAPVPCKGQLGVWRLPDDVEAKVTAQLAERKA